MKNLLLIGDAFKSVWFAAFQEDPYKLVVLSKDIRHICVTSAEFFFTEEQMSMVTGDEDGIIRMYEYSPNGTSDMLKLNFILTLPTQTQSRRMVNILYAVRNSMDKLNTVLRSR